MTRAIDIEGRGVRINGRSVGVGVGNATPDAEDLHARYDATELSLNDGDDVSTWGDETGNGYDLTTGTVPTYNASAINGNPAVGFDGSNDYLDVSFSSLSQPNHIFMVAQVRSVSSADTWYDADTGGGQQFFEGAGDWSLFAGTTLSDGSNDTNKHIHGHLFNGTSSVMRLDGTQTASGDVGGGSLDGFTLGARGSVENFADILVGEVLIYPQDKSSIASDVESYLSDKWGITV